MKKVYLLTTICLLLACKLIAKSGGPRVFQLNKLGKPDTLLNGWVFHTGDDMNWAQPGFDDRDWQQTDPGTDIFNYQPLKHSKVIWLRLHVKLDSPAANTTLAAWVNQFTASQIYLDGKLIKQYGYIHGDNIKAISPGHELFVLPLQEGREQVIAVRLGYQAGIPYIGPNFMPMPAFSMYLNGYPAAVVNLSSYQASVKKLVSLGLFFIGVFVFISIIYLAYFIFDRTQKTHLYYLVFAFCNLVAWGVSVPFFNNIDNVALQVTQDAICSAANIIAAVFSVLVIYVIFNYHGRAWFKVLIFVGLCSFCWLFAGAGGGFFACVILMPTLGVLEGARVSIWALKSQRKVAIVILPFLVLCVIFNVWSALLDETSLVSQLIGGLSIVCLPLGMALYLAIQEALRKKRLAVSLAEVQILSEQKQQILADQNVVLEHQVNERTAELNQSLVDLKQTQGQLIQSAKMASLGELTAGIAHEIQNPLNFVNNFSEVNREMLQELKAESEKPKAERDEQLEVELINDLIGNEEKINHHGKRADGIVKSMLEHSRISAGQKEPTDLNKLADEYLRLAYHGLKAKDQSLDIEIITHFDENLPPVTVIPHDIGRVLLNLFNNAFYAVNQRSKASGMGYKPEVTVTTIAGDGNLQIKVRDNGVGIPDAIKDKIMQPFFTTKPTGEATGLGLSLSYDIVVKGHGGKIEVISSGDGGAEFIISLPL